MRALEKNWNDYVVSAEAVARSEGFCALRDCILERAALDESDRVIDLGAGTGLLTLPAAARARSVWAVDISPAMTGYLDPKARSAGLENVTSVVASVTSLPLVDGSVDVALSNYCFHHLADDDKIAALREVRRVLAPGGRLVLGDMMFSLRLGEDRNREIVKTKVRSLLAKGPAGAWRLARNGARLIAGRWERPANPDWWRTALAEVGFERITVETLSHEGGIACARRP